MTGTLQSKRWELPSLCSGWSLMTAVFVPLTSYYFQLFEFVWDSFIRTVSLLNMSSKYSQLSIFAILLVRWDLATSTRLLPYTFYSSLFRFVLLADVPSRESRVEFLADVVERIQDT